MLVLMAVRRRDLLFIFLRQVMVHGYSVHLVMVYGYVTPMLPNPEGHYHRVCELFEQVLKGHAVGLIFFKIYNQGA